MGNTLGVVLPTNNPESFYRYLLPSLGNIECASKYIEFLINFQSPWKSDSMIEVISTLSLYGFSIKYSYNFYNVKSKGLVPVNKIREDTARLDDSCKFYLIFDDDMSFLKESPKITRTSGEQLLEAILYMYKYPDCGVLVFGGNLIKNIKKDTIAPIHIYRDYVTGKGIIFKNHDKDSGCFVPNDAYELLGSDEEKVAAAYRISQGYYVSELPFTRINHYENQLSKRNKSGKIPGYQLYEWNASEIREVNNFKFIRDNYSKYYTFGKGNVVDLDKYISVSRTGNIPWSKDVIHNYTINYEYLNIKDMMTLIDQYVQEDIK